MNQAALVKYRVIGTEPATRRSVSVLCLGAMLMGSRTDEETSFAILDRYVSAGGTFIDTSGNYAFWVNGTQGQGGGAAAGAELFVRRVHGRPLG